MSSSAARLWPSTVTIAPARESDVAISRPMPRAPPVTSACEDGDSSDMPHNPSRLSQHILSLKFLQEARNPFASVGGLLDWRREARGDHVSAPTSLTTKDGRFGYEAAGASDLPPLVFL